MLILISVPCHLIPLLKLAPGSSSFSNVLGKLLHVYFSRWPLESLSNFKGINPLAILIIVTLSLYINTWRTEYILQYSVFPFIDLSLFNFCSNRVLLCLYGIKVASLARGEDGIKAQRWKRGERRWMQLVTIHPHLWPHPLYWGSHMGPLYWGTLPRGPGLLTWDTWSRSPPFLDLFMLFVSCSHCLNFWSFIWLWIHSFA